MRPVGFERPLYGVAFSDTMRGTAVGGITGIVWSAVVMRTVDGGMTWHSQLYVSDRLFMSVAYSGEVGTVVGSPGSLWSYDGGESWIQGSGITPTRVAFFSPEKAAGVAGHGFIAVAP